MAFGLLGWFGVGAGAKEMPDVLWATRSAKFEGIGAQAGRLRSQGAAVAVVVHFPATLGALQESLSATGVTAQVIVGRERVAPAGSRRRDPLRLLHAAAISADAPINPRDGRDAYVLVAERHPLRRRDADLVRRARSWGDRVRVCFHVSLEDEFLGELPSEEGQALAGLKAGGPGSDRGVSDPAACRAVAVAQAKIASLACGDADARSAQEWLRLNCRRAAA